MFSWQIEPFFMFHRHKMRGQIKPPLGRKYFFFYLNWLPTFKRCYSCCLQFTQGSRDFHFRCFFSANRSSIKVQIRARLIKKKSKPSDDLRSRRRPAERWLLTRDANCDSFQRWGWIGNLECPEKEQSRIARRVFGGNGGGAFEWKKRGRHHSFTST